MINVDYLLIMDMGPGGMETLVNTLYPSSGVREQDKI